MCQPFKLPSGSIFEPGTNPSSSPGPSLQMAMGQLVTLWFLDDWVSWIRLVSRFWFIVISKFWAFSWRLSSASMLDIRHGFSGAMIDDKLRSLSRFWDARWLQPFSCTSEHHHGRRCVFRRWERSPVKSPAMPEGELVTLDYTALLRWRNAKPHRTDKTSLKSATKLELHGFWWFHRHLFPVMLRNPHLSWCTNCITRPPSLCWARAHLATTEHDCCKWDAIASLCFSVW